MFLAGAAIASFGASIAATPVWAQAARQYSVPASDAGDAVQAVAQQSGLQVIAPAADLAGVRTNAIRGSFSAVEALRRMFAGTGLEVVQTAGGAVMVRRAAVAPAAQTAAPDQETPAASEEVVVTGSRILRPGFDTLQAATSTDSEEIERRSYTNVLEALQDTPGFAPAASSQIGTSQGTLGIAQSFANFFGLGSQRTLSLVNGRRFVSSNTVSGSGGSTSPGSQVDLNLIPVGLIERVETVAIGGAPVYGSDAIAGTVNVILKEKYEGFQLTGQASISDRGDAANQMVRALVGKNFAGGRGNIVLGAEYVRQEGMVLGRRFPFRYLMPSGNEIPGDGISSQLVVGDLRYAPLTDGGLPYRSGYPMPGSYIVDGAGNPLQFGSNGDLIPFRLGAPFYGSSISGIPVFTDGGDGMNPAKHTSLLSPNERYLFNLNANFDVTDNLNFFVEGSYAHTSGTKLSDLFQFAAPGILGGPALSISVNNPFLSQQARSILAANGITTSFRLNRNFNDIVDRFPANTSFDVFRIVAGLKGDFKLGSESWNWDVSYNYGKSRNRTEFNSINLTRLQNALNATSTTTCAVGGNCVPINIFGEGAASDAAVNYVLDRGVGISKNSMEVFSANLSGNLPFGIAGPISVGIGYEHRREAGSFEGDAILNGGLTLLGGAIAYPDAPEGSFNTDELYGEAIVPLINDGMNLPFIKALQAEGAIRYVDHSVSGGDITWSGGARMQTRLDGLTLRGVYTRAIRNPSLVELFLNTTPVARAAFDVCAPSRIGTGPNPSVRRANCTAALAAAGVTTSASFGPTTNGASPFGQILGNSTLDNEKARSWSVGLVYQPPAIRNLRLSLDYSRIRLANAISRFDLVTAQAACYDSPNFPNEIACQSFRRLNAAEAAAQSAATGRQRVAGDLADGYKETYYNSARLDFAGIIGEINYAFAVPNLAGTEPGQLRLGLKAFYIDYFRTQASVGGSVIEGQGTVGSPRWDVNGRIGYAFDPFDWDVQVLWSSKTVGSRTLTYENTPVNDYPSYTLVNTTFSAKVTDNFSLQFTVRNLFDRQVPYSATVTRSFGAYDPIGRTFTARAAVSF